MFRSLLPNIQEQCRDKEGVCVCVCVRPSHPPSHRFLFSSLPGHRSRDCSAAASLAASLLPRQDQQIPTEVDVPPPRCGARQHAEAGALQEAPPWSLNVEALGSDINAENFELVSRDEICASQKQLNQAC